MKFCLTRNYTQLYWKETLMPEKSNEPRLARRKTIRMVFLNVEAMHFDSPYVPTLAKVWKFVENLTSAINSTGSQTITMIDKPETYCFEID